MSTSITQQFDLLRLELATKAKSGLDFILAASVVWAAITLIWFTALPAPTKGFITFFLGALTLPLAWVLSKLLRTTWALPHNPLQPLGLVLNFAQLFYFPFLIFMYMRYPQHFIMTYGIITGAHFFPYAWLYRATPYALAAGFISVGSLVLGMRLAPEHLYLIPAFLTAALLLLAGLLLVAHRRHHLAYATATAR
ncbi:DUF7010 family protein [Hymenobacter endophyticus]|uniref:Uncharacterized protein n=1 Tax=Hymenobacter endophyticus TaxID=3076335 RepID=A0ABU3TJ44_9BACT|nr:hypothetical protein [Hymenobacter endophyticus]MDU0371395.1 hypothetical protein [Hymenobacter endophyticus]